MRKFIIGVSVLLAVLAGGLFYLFSSLDGIVKKGVERVGSEVAGVKVTVGGVALRLAEGKAVLSGLTVANPSGFSTEPAIRLGEIVIAFDTTSLNRSPFVVKDVTVASPTVALELGAKGSNLAALRHNVTGADEIETPELAVTPAEAAKPDEAKVGEAKSEDVKAEEAKPETAPAEAAKPEAAPVATDKPVAAKPEPAAAKSEPVAAKPDAKPAEKKVVIRQIAIAQGQVTLAVAGVAGATTNTKLDEIVLKDLGQAEGGVTTTEIAQTVLDALLSSALKSATTLIVPQAAAEPEVNKGPAPAEVGDVLKGNGDDR